MDLPAQLTGIAVDAGTVTGQSVVFAHTSVPALVEVTVHRDYPLSGSPAVGWWDVPVPTYLKERRQRYEKERAEENLS